MRLPYQILSTTKEKEVMTPYKKSRMYVKAVWMLWGKGTPRFLFHRMFNKAQRVWNSFNYVNVWIGNWDSNQTLNFGQIWKFHISEFLSDEIAKNLSHLSDSSTKKMAQQKSQMGFLHLPWLVNLQANTKTSYGLVKKLSTIFIEERELMFYIIFLENWYTQLIVNSGYLHLISKK